MSLKNFVCFFSLLSLLSGLDSTALAQSTASLSGMVTDASGAVVPNAAVTATNQGTGVASVTQVDNSGAYLFPALPIGMYRIEVSAANFQTAEISNLKLEVATSMTQNVQLRVRRGRACRYHYHQHGAGYQRQNRAGNSAQRSARHGSQPADAGYHDAACQWFFVSSSPRPRIIRN